MIAKALTSRSTRHVRAELREAVARILIADSDPIHREAAGICLEQHGHRISVVADGSAVIRRIESDPPDLILTDVMLPMRSGYDILNAIARQPTKLRLPVIFLTVRSSNTDMARALTAGVADYIVKPFVPSELAMRIHLALNRELDSNAA